MEFFLRPKEVSGSTRAPKMGRHSYRAHRVGPSGSYTIDTSRGPDYGVKKFPSALQEGDFVNLGKVKPDAACTVRGGSEQSFYRLGSAILRTAI